LLSLANFAVAWAKGAGCTCVQAGVEVRRREHVQVPKCQSGRPHVTVVLELLWWQSCPGSKFVCAATLSRLKSRGASHTRVSTTPSNLSKQPRLNINQVGLSIIHEKNLQVSAAHLLAPDKGRTAGVEALTQQSLEQGLSCPCKGTPCRDGSEKTACRLHTCKSPHFTTHACCMRSHICACVPVTAYPEEPHMQMVRPNQQQLQGQCQSRLDSSHALFDARFANLSATTEAVKDAPSPPPPATASYQPTVQTEALLVAKSC
jgi:hypothetical protein